uniref:Deoxynucleotidyltransferase terminal-interacting protein 2 n=1 Tax=Nothoprocta perdicaria TaxID=30464 RepID=A0A8C6YZX8_NOTPE
GGRGERREPRGLLFARPAPTEGPSARAARVPAPSLCPRRPRDRPTPRPVSPPRGVAEPQADGDVSETESNCSSVSGLQTPLIIRVTRRRQIVVPYQPDSPAKRRQDRTAFLKELMNTQDEDDVSEAESCSSAVSGVRTPNVTKSTRSRQRRKKVQSEPIFEAQGEDVSDAETCCFLTEPSVTTKRITRSMQMKSQKENAEQIEKANKIASEDQILIEDTGDKEPSPLRNGSKEVCSQVQEKCNQIYMAGEEPKSMDLALTDHTSVKQSLKSPGQVTPNKSKKDLQQEGADNEVAVQESFNHADELSVDKPCDVVSSPQKEKAIAQVTGSIGGESRMLETGGDSDENETGQYSEPESHGSGRSNSKNDSFTLFLNKDESDESENSDIADTCIEEEELINTRANKRTPSFKKSLKEDTLHAEGLFVIDTEPGMGSSQQYYLDRVDLVSDAGTEHEGGAKGEESSDVEDAEEDLIDEEEKDKQEVVLQNKKNVLFAFIIDSSVDFLLHRHKCIKVILVIGEMRESGHFFM